MSEMPSVSVTIVNHQARDLLRVCLSALEERPYTQGKMEVVVLDNASGDGSIEMLGDEFPSVVVVPEPLRRGFGANQNRAISEASGQFVFMLNPDAVVGEGTIDSLVEAIQGNEQVVAASCRTLNSDGTLRQKWPIAFPTPLSVYAKAVGLGKRRRDGGLASAVFDDRWLGGGALLIDRERFLGIGGFDESFFMYSEDVDLCKRLRSSGYLFTWVAEASVTHPLPNEPLSAVQRRQREMVKAELLYMTRYYGAIGRFAYRAGVALDSAIRILALRFPRGVGSVDLHGGSIEDARLLYRARLDAAMKPNRDGGLSELAGEWNARHGNG